MVWCGVCEGEEEGEEGRRGGRGGEEVVLVVVREEGRGEEEEGRGGRGGRRGEGELGSEIFTVYFSDPRRNQDLNIDFFH